MSFSAGRARAASPDAFRRPFRAMFAIAARARTALRSMLVLTVATASVTAVQAQQNASPTIAARSWLLMDVTSGQVLASHEPDTRTEPASLTKLMTAHLAFQALAEKRIAIDARPPVSPAAYKAIGSRMFVEPARPATVEELLNGMIVQSGNDASIVLAEAISGTEQSFAEAMNQEAGRLGMKNTHYRNATGLPDPEHYTTARDLALLAVRVIGDYPDLYPLYSKKEYTYNNIKQPNRNRLLFVDPSVDGLKTGHTEAAGYCLVATAKREQTGGGFQRRLLSIVLGSTSEQVRAIESQKLLNWGFQNFDAIRVQTGGQPAGQYRVFKGAEDNVPGGTDGDLIVTVPRGQGDRVRGEIERTQSLVAPLSRGQRIGTIRVRLDDQLLAEKPLIALADVPPAGFIGRAWDSLLMLFTK